MRPTSLPLATILLLSLACALGDDDDDDDDGDDDATDSDSAAAADDHPNCSSYIECVAEVTPEATSSAMDAYGDGSACWSDDESGEICEPACADAIHDLHLSNAGAEACDDGTNVPSENVLVKRTWTLYMTEGEGHFWDYKCEDGFFDFEFEPNETNEFAAVFSSRHRLTCTNETLALSCADENSHYVLDVSLSSDLQEMAGTFAYLDESFDDELDNIDCTWQASSEE
jgi:hypothetical protein